MKNIIIDKSGDGGDFVPLFSGEERCESGHLFGPYIRDYYLIHFCLSGKGTLTDKYGEHKIEGGQLFIIREGESTVYKADESAPWHYIWIATEGKRAEKLEELPSVASCDGDFIGRIRAAIDKDESRAEIYISFLFELLYKISKSDIKEKNDKLSAIRRYIKYNYMTEINVESISKLFGFERSYLYRIFKKRYGIGVKEYIIKVRMEKAEYLLKEGRSVGEVSLLVGYSDEFAFSKAFKKINGLCPLNFKKSVANNK